MPVVLVGHAGLPSLCFCLADRPRYARSDGAFWQDSCQPWAGGLGVREVFVNQCAEASLDLARRRLLIQTRSGHRVIHVGWSGSALCFCPSLLSSARRLGVAESCHTDFARELRQREPPLASMTILGQYRCSHLSLLRAPFQSACCQVERLLQRGADAARWQSLQQAPK